MAPKSEWNKLVKKTYDEGKKKNPNYKLGDAMRDASRARSRGMAGGQVVEETEEVIEEVPTQNAGAKKKRRNKKVRGGQPVLNETDELTVSDDGNGDAVVDETIETTNGMGGGKRRSKRSTKRSTKKRKSKKSRKTRRTRRR